MGLPSVWSAYLFRMAMLLVVLAFFTPLIARGYVKVRKPRNTAPPIRLSLWHRCISVLLAYIMLIGPFGFEQLAHGDTQYNGIETLDWANGNRDVHYDYDDNGSLIEKITAVKGEADPDTNYIEKVTYEYNLQNRLWRVTTDDTGATDAVVEYTYNDAGIKVKAYSYDYDGQSKSGEVTKIFLIDSHNHTGHAQVLERWSPSGSHPDVTYTIGDDVVTQYDSANGARHLLYDGHGSTRQLVDDNEVVTDAFSYDGYGVMLGGNPANAATSLLYTGEMYDSSASMYYLRARWYDQQTGRFNRMDPFAGNKHDPQSLHKYLYVHRECKNSSRCRSSCSTPYSCGYDGYYLLATNHESI
jgi:RHS repeat-associated protein